MKKILLGSAALLVAACASSQMPWQKTEAVAEAPAASVAAPVLTVEDAETFITAAEAELTEMGEYAARVYWLQATNINFDTNWLVSKVGAKYTQMAVRLANGTKKYEDLDLPDELARKMSILKAGITIPAPSTDGVADELANITTNLESTYSTGTFEHNGEKLNLTQLSNIIAESRDPEELATVWAGWREISKPMKSEYARMVEIANEGARELGFSDTADMWLANYDMPSADMEKEVERLWTQVEPLYDQLHCKVRADLNEKYGDDVQPADGFIRADLLGNMWAQQWSNIYDIVGPETSGPSYDVTTKLEEKGYTPLKMVETAENFFTSLGLEELPETFWERSQITRPRDREVVCHASAWDLDSKDDIRIKMCTQVNAEDFQTVHHELGHNYYQRAYKNQSTLHQGGAHDGFHEAIGDFLALSITPSYLKDIGLIEESEIPDASADTGLLMNQALDKIAFLPFGLMVDKWRWEVFRGETTPEEYNDSWVKLRQQYQGITPPVERASDAFDPGAKYHIPGNTPYLRYFLSFVMQFQFHKAACEMSGWEGPLHRCSIYNNKEVGEKFNAMMEMGASKPWPDALEAFTGTREMDGSAIIEYFDPLMTYLKEENEGRACGWK
ncbi:M2 family metallopeptidase [Hirschia baltica]|uniref:Peptidyl-dipeptidase A n=1 Tax=Hirschia baltica (strain ATCC 49814 / DSM 5838 / IFAM 1418) TaxID=582402 RepID=C6XNP7_HIRBI|nr:M2 family metallopeptidase [Hirschia baltica]ACT58300.1 Peptidyl-dipeptidase A [Hirschia baltica ATCC 49814]